MQGNRIRMRISTLIFLAFTILFQASCSQNSLRHQGRPTPNIDTSVPPSQSSEKDADLLKTSDRTYQVENDKKTIALIQKATPDYLGQERNQSPKVVKSDAGINLNFQNLSLDTFVQAVLGDALKENYVIDPSINGSVTIQTVKPIPETDLLGVLQEVLALNGATLLLKNGRYQVLPLSKAAQLPVVTRVKRLQNQGFGLQVVPLQYISAKEMAKILEPASRNQSIVYVDDRRNLLILSGSEPQLVSMIDMISIFDVDWLAGKSIALFSLRYVDAKTLISELEGLLDGKAGALFNGVVKLIPIERNNSLLAVSSSQSYIDRVAEWAARLDVADDKVDKRLFVYPLKNTKATELAETINKIFTSNQKSNNSINKPTATVAPNQQAITLSNNVDVSEPKPASATNSIAITESSQVKIIADEVSNTLVIMGTARDYEMVESAIRKLDVLPKQVLVEATIAEVTLGGDLSFGVEWFFKNGGFSDTKSGQGQLSLGTDGISSITPGFSYSIIDAASNVRFVLNTLESETNVQVLSSPSVMVLDNNSATINVGDDIPVPTRQSTSNTDPNAPTVNEIEYRTTGILLEISPRINEGGLVTLDVKQEVSDAVTTQTSGIDAPTIQQRTINSTVAIQNGQSVILGGLIREKQEDSQSGVPVLGRLPIIGNLFSQTSNSDRRTELLVILTPRVIANPTEAYEITNEFRQKLIRPLNIEQSKTAQ